MVNRSKFGGLGKLLFLNELALDPKKDIMPSLGEFLPDAMDKMSSDMLNQNDLNLRSQPSSPLLKGGANLSITSNMEGFMYQTSGVQENPNASQGSVSFTGTAKGGHGRIFSPMDSALSPTNEDVTYGYSN